MQYQNKFHTHTHTHDKIAGNQKNSQKRCGLNHKSFFFFFLCVMITSSYCIAKMKQFLQRRVFSWNEHSCLCGQDKANQLGPRWKIPHLVSPSRGTECKTPLSSSPQKVIALYLPAFTCSYSLWTCTDLNKHRSRGSLIRSQTGVPTQQYQVHAIALLPPPPPKKKIYEKKGREKKVRGKWRARRREDCCCIWDLFCLIKPSAAVITSRLEM